MVNKNYDVTEFSYPLQPALPPDLVSAAGQMATSWRARSSSSTWERLRLKKANKCTAVWCINKIHAAICHCGFIKAYNTVHWHVNLNFITNNWIENSSIMGIDIENPIPLVLIFKHCNIPLFDQREPVPWFSTAQSCLNQFGTDLAGRKTVSALAPKQPWNLLGGKGALLLFVIKLQSVFSALSVRCESILNTEA